MKIKIQLLSTERARHASAHETLRAFRCWSTSLTLLLGDCWTGVMCARARLPAVSLLTFRVFRLFRPRRLIRRFAFIVIRVFRLFRHLLVKAEPEPNGT